MIIERTINGYWRISDIIRGYRVQRVYVGFTRNEAIEEFINDIQKLGGSTCVH